MSGLTDDILLFELGQLDYDEMVELFQRLLDTGMVWSLQGSYQRTAFDLLRAGEIVLPEQATG